MGDSLDFDLDDESHGPGAYKNLWHSVWVAWHYAAISLTHHDALLSTGIVEYGIPTALSSKCGPPCSITTFYVPLSSTAQYTIHSHVESAYWELGKPRAKYQRDVYADRDVIRIVRYYHCDVLQAHIKEGTSLIIQSRSIISSKSSNS